MHPPSHQADRLPQAIQARGHRILLDPPRVLIMGIVNVTPDSFSDGGRFLDPEAAVAHACDLVRQGADLLDIGAESTRPGSEPVEEAEEIRRLLPVVREVCRRVTVPVSVDTMKARVAQLALEAGASIINDVSALRADPDMAGVVADKEAGLVLMHMRGTPRDMQAAPHYQDVVGEVRAFLEERAGAALGRGVLRSHILLDPGIGFGKNRDHNLALLARLPELAELGYPLLVGVSRKGFIGQILDRPVEERLMGTAGAVAAAVLGGARVVRVHDVREMREVVAIAEAIRHTRDRRG